MPYSPDRTDSDTPLRRWLKETRAAYAIAAFFSLFLNLLMLVSPIYMMQVFDRVLQSGSGATLTMLTLIAVFALITLGFLEILRTWVMSSIGNWLGKRMGASVLAATIDAHAEGDLTGSQSLRDLSQLQSVLSGAAITALFDAPWTPIFIVVIALLHPMLGLFAAVSAAILFAIAIANDVMTREVSKKSNQLQVMAFKTADEAIQNAEVVHGMGMLRNLLSAWNTRNQKALQAGKAATDRAGIFLGLSKFLRMFVQIGILAIGAALVLTGDLTGGGMIAGSILLGRALAPVEQSINSWRQFVSARQSYDRLNGLLDAYPAPEERMPLPAPSGRIDVNNVSFIPPGTDKPVLKNVSFSIEPGEVCAIIGPSAVGKTTLCRLLVGMWAPSAGTVRLDGAETHSWPRNDFGKYVGYLPQQIELFTGTVRENIARMGEADAEEIIEAAQLADVHDMILHMPLGYDTPVGDMGAYLSGGQRQRIGLARALFGKPKLLVLDEPNANLDQAGEAALNRTIGVMKKMGTSIVLVAHRSSVLSNVDKLLVLRDGMVQHFGPRDQVLAAVQNPNVQPLQPRERGVTRQGGVGRQAV